MKNTFSTKISNNQEFNAWTNAQESNPDYDYKLTTYYRYKMLEKNTKFFAAAFIVAVIAVNLFLLFSLFLYFN